MNIDDVKADIDKHFAETSSDEVVEYMKTTCENMFNAQPLDAEFAKILNDNLCECLM